MQNCPNKAFNILELADTFLNDLHSRWHKMLLKYVYEYYGYLYGTSSFIMDLKKACFNNIFGNTGCHLCL